MAVVKKKVKQVHTIKNGYVPHRIRSHPFYFIQLPLRVIMFFVFFWIVLVPVLYFILLEHVVGFAPFSLYYFIGMLILFIFALSIFMCEWKCKKNKEATIYYIECEALNAREMMPIKSHRTLTELQKIDEKDVTVRESAKKVPPPHLVIEENNRPQSQNINSPLTPRELFFIDMYEYAHKSMRNVTNEFLEKERLFYDPSGPVYITSSDYSTDGDKSEQHSIDQCSVEHLPQEQQSPIEQYPTEQCPIEQYPIEEHPVDEEPPKREEYIAPLHSRLSRILQEHTPKKEPMMSSNVTDGKPAENEFYMGKIIPHDSCKSEAYLFVEEPESTRRPISVTIDVHQ